MVIEFTLENYKAASYSKSIPKYMYIDKIVSSYAFLAGTLEKPNHITHLHDFDAFKYMPKHIIILKSTICTKPLNTII